MSTHYPVIVVGGGQAGLSVSYCLKQRGIGHIIFEKHHVAHAWQKKRWDSFCLVTPNWQCQLPGYSYTEGYAGTDTDGFMQRDEIVAYVKSYAQSFQAPVREGVEVLQLRRQAISAEFELTTTDGLFTADHVVIATGGYHTPKIPRLAERLPSHIQQLHSSDYKNAQALPPGAVLVVGTGQSGCQIAEDLHLEGRQVHLSVGSAPRSPRRYRGKDVVAWLDDMGYYDMPIDDHPRPNAEVRAKTNHYVTGRGGGREIDLRHFALEGMQLHGRLVDVVVNECQFKDDLASNLHQADAAAARIKRSIDDFIQQNNIAAPSEAPYQPAWEPSPHQVSHPLNLQTANISSVIWAVGYHLDFRWIEIPVFDGKGYPSHTRGVTPISGLHFLGLPWLHTWGSGRFSGIARDAEHVADAIGTQYWRGRLDEQISQPGCGQNKIPGQA